MGVRATGFRFPRSVHGETEGFAGVLDDRFKGEQKRMTDQMA